MTQSIGATGICYDYAAAEAFFASLRANLRSELSPSPSPSASVAEVRAWLQQWIEEWYKLRRPHIVNEGRSPATAWDQLITASGAVSPT